MTSHFSIAPGVSCCNADDRIVFLDLKREHYFQLNEVQTRWFEALMSQGTAPPPTQAEQLGANLERMGLLSRETEACQVEGPAHQTAHTSLQDYPIKTEYSLRLSQLPEVGWSAAYTAFALKRYGLQAVLDRHAARKRQLSNSDRGGDTGADELAGQFIGWSPALFTSHDACLFSSLALARYLISRSYVSDIVIGVRSQPFRAHCWVQRGDRVLNEHLENTRNYRPILIV